MHELALARAEEEHEVTVMSGAVVRRRDCRLDQRSRHARHPANLVVDTYTVQVELPSFKTLSRPGVSVGPGTRVSVGKFTIGWAAFRRP